MASEVHHRYPLWMVLVALGVNLSTCLLGAFILSGFGAPAVVLYLALCVFCEFSCLRGSCVNCCYYGKVCGLGRGKVCSLLFRRGDPEKFAKREVSVRDMVPEMLVSVLPLLAGIIILVRHFRWSVLLAMLLIVLLASAGNAFVRGSLACKHCAQRLLGCPAERLFNRRRADSNAGHGDREQDRSGDGLRK